MRISLARGVKATKKQVLNSPLFAEWAASAPSQGAVEVKVNAVLVWDGRITMLQLSVFLRDGREHLALLRDPTVDAVTLIAAGGKWYIVFVEQSRPALGAVVRSNPAGAVDPGEDPVVAALREVIEEVQGDRQAADYPHIEWQPPVLMQEKALGIPMPFSVTSGTTNEKATFCLVYGTTDVDTLQFLASHTGGATGTSERTKLRVLEFDPANPLGVLLALGAWQDTFDLKATFALLILEKYLAKHKLQLQ